MRTRLESLSLAAAWLSTALLAIPPCAQAPGEDSVIQIRPGSAWNETGGDDVAVLKHLAAGVGWEFTPTAETTAELKRIGIRRIRCINVDPLPGAFAADGTYAIASPNRLDAHLDTCRQVGADPHVCLGLGVPEALKVQAAGPAGEAGIMGQTAVARRFWNGDWPRFRAYWRAYFDYVLVRNGFRNARFEVGNEPDIGGQFPRLAPGPAAMGSTRLYEDYFEVYRNLAETAAEFERERGIPVVLGGPAVAWAYTFKFGEFNWIERFLKDCAARSLKLDFIGVHYYGNVSSLDGRYEAVYPPFTAMMRTTRAARDAHAPRTPIILSEWGPSYITDNSPASAVNADHIGAAWSAEFLSRLMACGVRDALYLVTTDQRRPGKEGAAENVWGWPSLFVNPSVFGRAYPKAPFHLFDFISRLEGGRVEATRSAGLGNLCAASGTALRCLVWNYDARIPEKGVPVEMGVRRTAALRVVEAAAFFRSERVRLQHWQVSGTVGDAHHDFQTRGTLDDRCRDTRIASMELRIVDGVLDAGIALPPSSVSLVELTPLDAGR